MGGRVIPHSEAMLMMKSTGKGVVGAVEKYCRCRRQRQIGGKLRQNYGTFGGYGCPSPSLTKILIPISITHSAYEGRCKCVPFIPYKCTDIEHAEKKSKTDERCKCKRAAVSPPNDVRFLYEWDGNAWDRLYVTWNLDDFNPKGIGMSTLACMTAQEEMNLQDKRSKTTLQATDTSSLTMAALSMKMSEAGSRAHDNAGDIKLASFTG
eukprot:gnl/TRDRNA2_/TRDRNA2_206000_c0_seq1.p2 gnl/TRDRNA2_/TRDRNA2_206000_c0~~gnl/TRDRNA2_/TRDRNA2_206000_c0_seq1.p2  ORF type:complete len:208 (+),score=9.84 gnl/TRDRNA2_/TRDRNA2_206000_c0_seq1:457-1080(+)